MVQNQLYEVDILSPEHPAREFPPTGQGSRVQTSPGSQGLTDPGAAGPAPDVDPSVHFIILT